MYKRQAHTQKKLVLWRKGCGSSGAGGLWANHASFIETSDTFLFVTSLSVSESHWRPSCLYKAICIISLLSAWGWLGISRAEMVMIQTLTSTQMSRNTPLPRCQGCLLCLGPPAIGHPEGVGGRSLLKEILCSNEREKTVREITRQFMYFRERTK